MDFSGNVLITHEEQLPSEAQSIVLDTISKVIRSLQDVSQSPVLGIHVASHGFVVPKQGMINSFPGNSNWLPIDICQTIRDEFGLDASVVHRVYAAAVSELRAHLDDDRQGNNFYCNSGPGSGFGMEIIQNGQVLRKYGTVTGFSHLRVAPDGQQCHCGGKGCLETVSSVKAILAKARRKLEAGVESSLRLEKTINLASIAKAAAEGDLLSISLLDEAGHFLGLAFSHLLNVIGARRIILSGSLTEGGNQLISAVQQAVRRFTHPICYNNLQWESAVVRQHAAAIGAAYLELDRIFEFEREGNKTAIQGGSAVSVASS